MQFRWSTKVNLIGGLLIAIFLRLSYWQYERHQWKLGYIASMRSRLEQSEINLGQLPNTPQQNWEELVFRKARAEGSYDFSHEVILRNRSYGSAMGVHALTPLRIKNSNSYVLVDRGFIPLSHSSLEARKPFQVHEDTTFVGLIKAGASPKFLAPKDPPSGPGLPWVDAWLRVDIQAIEKQLPYKLLPIYLEIMETQDAKAVEQKMLDARDGREEMFMLAPKEGLMQLAQDDIAPGKYPLPVFDTIIPPGRHFGYIFEWAAMALMTLLACLVLQLKRNR
ncbi:MAG: SURF1 family protein [Oligoflexia bacterium]|nr:SURF1 family protein [Oligoflexia bacterium]